ncbi:MAG TPA: ATP-binding protein [Oscillatoriaceae cyanobacterium M33_DOE_052]|uniref:Molecular chaperone HtpG n=1 Tax=Planktothricoides sp. SpSt-374 TaxID=2282167 RepID=A0A7C3VK83_9CYAN|nr:ATP-binding protein [Oscillatoriaceae cyanobacterium M33_DOE_052]
MLEMKFDFDGLIQLLARNLYSEKHVFIRELIQNAHDAIIRRRAQEGDTYSGKITIETRPDDLKFIIQDTGIGMSEQDLIEYLSTVGKGATRIARQEQQTEGLIGLFGIGFLSAFVVASRVEVKTRRFGESQGWIWQNSGNKDYTLDPCQIDQPGTIVTVFLKGEEEKGVILKEEVEKVIRRYADFLRIPIHLNGSSQPINAMRMPWERSGASPEEIEFDTRIYLDKTMRDYVLEVIPVNLPEQQINGALYITRTRTVQRSIPRAVRLFVNRMFICEKEPDLLPEWAEFVNGVICAEDGLLTLTAARDNFIRDEHLKHLQARLGDLIVHHMEKLAQKNPQRFSEILRFHNRSIKAACHYYDEFFDKFADLLEWRTNKGTPTTDLDDFNPEWRTIPKILELLPKRDNEPQILPYISSHNAANQYFQMADAANTLVVDASYTFEEELIKAYAERAGDRIKLVAVDRVDDPNVFKEAKDESDQHLKRLAESMSQVITPGGPGGTGRVRTEVRYFEPQDLTALIRSSEASTGEMKAREILNDPNSSTDLREMAQEMLGMARNASMRLVINANNPMVQRLAQQNFNDPDVINLMLNIYNSAILYNQELMTPQNARIFYEQFQKLMSRSLDYIVEQQDLQRQAETLEKERETLRKRDQKGPEPKHLIFFLMTPLGETYQSFIETVRDVIENRFGCQLFVANDRQFQDTVIDNVRSHMDQAHSFIAEVTDANPNVMFELGAARFDLRERPIVLMRRNSQQQLPADLLGRIYVNYDEKTGKELADYLENQLLNDQRIKLLLEKTGREYYISPKRLKEVSGWSQILEEQVWQSLAEQYPTKEAWRNASLDKVKSLLGKESDLGEVLLQRIQKSLGN